MVGDSDAGLDVVARMESLRKEIRQHDQRYYSS